MKQVLIIIRPNMYYQTKEALIEKHFYSMSIKDVVGRGASAISFYSQEDEKMANMHTLIL
jgi:nitrogen regulatory protein PII 2